MKKILGVLGIVAFWLGAYYMGNLVLGNHCSLFSSITRIFKSHYILDSYYQSSFVDQIAGTLVGVIIWFGIGAILFLSYIIYSKIAQMSRRNITKWLNDWK